MVRRQTAADSGPSPDAGERRPLHSPFGDELGGRVQQGVFGPAPSLRLALALDCSDRAIRTTYLLVATSKQVRFATVERHGPVGQRERTGHGPSEEEGACRSSIS